MKIAWFSDTDMIGSGYKNLSTKFCEGLVADGHEVKVIGLHYDGREHSQNYSIIPVMDFQSSLGVIYNLKAAWDYDILVVALDIPLQNLILNNLQQIRSHIKYVGIMPIEADPLCLSWGMVLLQMDLPLIISKFGTEEAHKVNVSYAKHLQLGVDAELWKTPTLEERTKFRRGLLGITDDSTFVVLTVADNQERKNLSAGMEAFRDFSRNVPNSKYVIVTRKHNPVGWALDDLSAEYGIQDKMIFMERGMPQEDLWGVYASADCFVLSSKAEGLGLPLLEAMSVGIPCIATNCTGMRELLENGRGWLIPESFIHRDPFGNGRRYWINASKLTEALHWVKNGLLPNIEAAKQFVSVMRWEDSIRFLNESLQKLVENENVTKA